MAGAAGTPGGGGGGVVKLYAHLATSRVEVWSKNNVRLAVISGQKKVFSPQNARIF